MCLIGDRRSAFGDEFVRVVDCSERVIPRAAIQATGCGKTAEAEAHICLISRRFVLC